MILNFHKRHDDDDIIQHVDINPIKFSDNKLWQLSVINFIGKFKKNLDESGIYFLSSSIIQRDDGNLHRIMFYMFLKKGTNQLDYAPNHPLVYKLRQFYIDGIEFYLTSVKTGKIYHLSELACSLEIKESNGWF